jgi:hypothetical protein
LPGDFIYMGVGNSAVAGSASPALDALNRSSEDTPVPRGTLLNLQASTNLAPGIPDAKIFFDVCINDNCGVFSPGHLTCTITHPAVSCADTTSIMKITDVCVGGPTPGAPCMSDGDCLAGGTCPETVHLLSVRAVADTDLNTPPVRDVSWSLVLEHTENEPVVGP